MAVTLMGGEKGGSGKSTLAVLYAAILAGQGRDVLLVDADIQGSATLWNSIRNAADIKPRITCVGVYGENLADEIRALTPKYDDIVIDTRGSDAPELRSAMLVANTIVTPAQTSQFDINTFATMDNLVKQARGFNPGLRALAVINRAPTNAKSSDVADMRKSLENLKQYALLSCVVSDRIAFNRVSKDGMAVSEYPKPDQKAVNEMRELALEIMQ